MIKHLTWFVLALLLSLSPNVVMAFGKCSSNSNGNGKSSTCGQSQCIVWSSSSANLRKWPINDSNSKCCYDNDHNSCYTSVTKPGTTALALLCPKKSPFSSNNVKMMRCGATCIPELVSAEGATSPASLLVRNTCTADKAQCSKFGFSKWCGFGAGFCADSCTTSCEDQGKVSCGSKCYKPSTHVCVDNKVICRKPDNDACGSKCYDNTTEYCANSRRNYVCHKSKRGTCAGVCFNESTQHCVSGRVCSKSANATCGRSCYNSATHRCIGTRVCKKNEDLCTGGNKIPQCYDPTKNGCCNGVLCGVHDADCLGKIYDKRTKSCVKAGFPKKGYICKKGDNGWKRCGKCYKKAGIAEGKSCYHNAECKSNDCATNTLACKRGICVCDEDKDCPGKWCDGNINKKKNKCRSRQSNGKKCSRDAQCTSLRCYAFRCKACSKDRQCPKGKKCKRGKCR